MVADLQSSRYFSQSINNCSQALEGEMVIPSDLEPKSNFSKRIMKCTDESLQGENHPLVFVAFNFLSLKKAH